MAHFNPPIEAQTKVLEDIRKEIIAAACHCAWHAYTVLGLGEPGAHWHEAPDWQKDGMRNAVDFWDELHEQDAFTIQKLCEASHQNWMRFKEADGWVYGPKKDAELKVHPCMVPFSDLPEDQKAKDEVVVNTYLQLIRILKG